MLLRRITQHVKNQNWFAVFLDFVIVVVGVFIGIQVANWNEARQDLAKEQAYLERLDKELVVIIERLENGSEVFMNSIKAVQYLITSRKEYNSNPDAYEVDTALLTSAFDKMKQGRVPASSPAAFKEMVSNGELALIRNQKLRKSLYEFDEFSNVALNAWGTLRDNLLIYLPETTGILTYKMGEEEKDKTSIINEYVVPDELDVDTLLNKPGLSGVLSGIMDVQANQLGLIERQLELARAIEAEIKISNPE